MTDTTLVFFWTMLRLDAVMQATGQRRSTFYFQLAQGLWTSPIRIAPRAVAWPAREIAALNAARIAGQTDAEIRALVKKLEAARTGAPELAANMCSLPALRDRHLGTEVGELESDGAVPTVTARPSIIKST